MISRARLHTRAIHTLVERRNVCGVGTDAILLARYSAAWRTLHFDAPLSRHHLAWLKASPHQPPSFCSLTTDLEPSPNRRRCDAARLILVSQFFFKLCLRGRNRAVGYIYGRLFVLFLRAVKTITKTRRHVGSSQKNCKI